MYNEHKDLVPNEAPCGIDWCIGLDIGNGCTNIDFCMIIDWT
jgi:hypothetical protein